MAGQREMVRRLLLEHGHDEAAVCAAYVRAEADGTVVRRRNATGHTPESYAAALWKDGHRRQGVWIENFCKAHGIALTTR
ncbi:hypothetical protein FBZ91_110148 [Nitrospirillum viridazoti]|nr:hypothetical protein FBZ91_110148 [Nitrospirillum amazonense]